MYLLAMYIMGGWRSVSAKTQFVVSIHIFTIRAAT